MQVVNHQFKKNELLLKSSVLPDISFKSLSALGALVIIVLIALVGFELYEKSKISIHQFGVGFTHTTTWDPAADVYGALPFIYGTLVSSILALIFAVPLGIGSALFISEIAPLRYRQMLISTIELLASVPSVIYGLWGIFVLIPCMRDHVYPGLQDALGFLPFFKGPIYGVSMLSGGIVVAVMILPIITSFSREILRSVPDTQREAAYALGATRWEVIRIAVLSYAKRGLYGAGILGLGRALGETMAITMVIGNSPVISSSLFAPGYTLASVIANEFTEATTDMHLSSLFELGLVLLVITLIVNAIAQLMLRQLTIGEVEKA